MTEPDFWDDNIAAQKTSQELNELKQTYENFHQMTELFDESEILLDFWLKMSRFRVSWKKSWLNSRK